MLAHADVCWRAAVKSGALALFGDVDDDDESGGLFAKKGGEGEGGVPAQEVQGKKKGKKKR